MGRGGGVGGAMLAMLGGVSSGRSEGGGWWCLQGAEGVRSGG